MIEVVRDPRCGRVEECIGESPFLLGRMCAAYTLGIQGDLRTKPLAPNKVLAMLKTFAGYSMPANGVNIANCVLGERELRSVYFPPVEQVIRETGVLSVMPSYNEVDGIPSHANRWLLEDVLRGLSDNGSNPPPLGIPGVDILYLQLLEPGCGNCFEKNKPEGFTFFSSEPDGELPTDGC